MRIEYGIIIYLLQIKKSLIHWSIKLVICSSNIYGISSFYFLWMYNRCINYQVYTIVCVVLRVLSTLSKICKIYIYIHIYMTIRKLRATNAERVLSTIIKYKHTCTSKVHETVNREKHSSSLRARSPVIKTVWINDFINWIFLILSIEMRNRDHLLFITRTLYNDCDQLFILLK